MGQQLPQQQLTSELITAFQTFFNIYDDECSTRGPGKFDHYRACCCHKCPFGNHQFDKALSSDILGSQDKC